MRFKTKAVHAGQKKDKETGATIPPIHISSTFTQESPGDHSGYEYSRTGNPTRTSLEILLASLENARYGLAYSSGMAAIHAAFSVLPKDSHVLLSTDVYGGSYRLVDRFLSKKDLSYDLVDTSDLSEVKNTIKENTAAILIESPSNPLLKITDIAGIKKTVGQKVNVIVDNTFATPYFQRPLELGGDIVLHSSTKYLGGHSDIIGGLVAVNDDELHDSLKFVQNSVGAVPSPFDCYLTTRGLKTLPLRMEAHQDNAMAIARVLKDHRRVSEVFYPGLDSHEGHDLAAVQMSGYSGMVSFRIKGGLRESKNFLESLKVFSLAESLGGVESLASLPLLMTHASFSLDLQKKIGITDDLIRLSAGIEDKIDLVEDVNQALDKL